MTYRKNPTTTDTFPKAGDQEADVVNRSGERAAGVYWVEHEHPATEAVTGGPTSHRTPIEINAQTGEQLDAGLNARARKMWGGRAASPESVGYLRNVLGVNHPGQTP